MTTNTILLRAVAGAFAVLSFALNDSVAVETLDQVHESTGNQAWQIGRQDYEAAQIVTPGITGQMTQVDVYIAREGVGGITTGNLIFDVRPVIFGAPLDSDGSAVFSSTILLTDTPTIGYGWVSVDLGAGVAVTAGNPFAITLRPESPLVATNAYLWHVRGTAAPDYPGGMTFDRQRPNVGPLTTWAPYSNRDLAFRTYVSTVPEPCTFVGLLTSALWLMLPRRRNSDAR